VEDADLAGVREGVCSKNFEYFGVGDGGEGRNGEVTGEDSMVFTGCQLLFCCSNG
jgi:hypothetical protein